MTMRLQKRNKKNKIIFAILLILLVGILVFLGFVMTKNITITDNQITYEQKTKKLNFDISNQGQVAIGTLDGGTKFSTSNKQQPIASMAKVITALVILDNTSSEDETFTVTSRDVEYYSREVIRNGSRLHVAEGEELTLRQAIESLMIISANNIADSLINWKFDDFETYKTVANQWLKDKNLANTTIGKDASGFDPSTTSSPNDMIEIGRLAMQNETLKQIVAEPTGVFPITGEEQNTNKLLNQGFNGIKTGNSDQALSCLLFARNYLDETIIGVMMGQPFNTTFDTANIIWDSIDRNFEEIIIPANTLVGNYILPWGGEVSVVTDDEISTYTWLNAQPEISLESINLNTDHNSEIGTIKLDDKTSTLRINDVIDDPSIWWRLTNLDQILK